MTDHETKKREYQERHRFWSDKRVAQLSFHNNLLLTVGIAVIGYFWSERKSIYTNLILDCDAKIDWLVVCFLIGIASGVVSVTTGFILSISRLYDLRLTSNIALTRKRALDKSVDIQEEDINESDFLESLKVLAVVSWNYKSYQIKRVK